MKIKSVEPLKGHYIEFEDSEYGHYIRYSKDNWMVAMGESYESIYNDEELEKAFQEYTNPVKYGPHGRCCKCLPRQ